MEIASVTYSGLRFQNSTSTVKKSVSTSSKSPSQGQTGKTGSTVEDQKIQQIVMKLKRTEAKVIAHERAHKAAGGPIVGPANYKYTTGPDGRRYVVAGEVSIQISEGKTPEETIRKMELVRRAALAPVDPSPQDRAIAAQAISIAAQAHGEIHTSSASQLYQQAEENATGTFSITA